MKRFLAVVALLVSGGLALASYAMWWEAKHYFNQGPSANNTTILIKAGTSLRGIGQQLQVAGVVESELLFRVGVMRRDLGTALKAGEYEFPSHVSEAGIADMLVHHRIVIHRVTIPEGLTSMMAVAIVNADPILSGNPQMPPPEGSLLPETYLFERGTTRVELIQRMQKAQTDLLAKLWPLRKGDLPIKDQREALILASMVEKETAVPSERGQIAAVFNNRLKIGMKLESDPTIIYGLSGGAPLGHPLRQSELAKPNPYSTYQITGLPPTPISNPGTESIAAVLNPPDSQAMFFVADGSGGHVFAKTAAEHAQNVARWRKIEAAKNQAGAQ